MTLKVDDFAIISLQSPLRLMKSGLLPGFGVLRLNTDKAKANQSPKRTKAKAAESGCEEFERH